MNLDRLRQIASEAESIRTPIHREDDGPTQLRLVAWAATPGAHAAAPDAFTLRAKASNYDAFAEHKSEGTYYRKLAALMREAADIIQPRTTGELASEGTLGANIIPPTRRR